MTTNDVNAMLNGLLGAAGSGSLDVAVVEPVSPPFVWSAIRFGGFLGGSCFLRWHGDGLCVGATWLCVCGLLCTANVSSWWMLRLLNCELSGNTCLNCKKSKRVWEDGKAQAL